MFCKCFQYSYRSPNNICSLHIQGDKGNIFPPFFKAYYQEGMEAQIFARLEILVQENPFFDLVTTGFSQGAALATICASQFASSYTMMRVSCIVFGSPKVGCEEFRLKNHSLPNLKVSGFTLVQILIIIVMIEIYDL